MQDQQFDTFVRDRLPPLEARACRLPGPGPGVPDDTAFNFAAALLERAIAGGYGDRPAVHAEDGMLSYAELGERAQRAAAVLVGELGLIPGNRVLLRGTNSLALAVAWFGVLLAGGVVVTTMPLLRAAELGKIAAKACIDIALCEAELEGELLAAAREGPWLKRRLCWGNGELEQRLARHAPLGPVYGAIDEPCLIAFTSGTTGKPKACVHSHRDLLSICELVGGRFLGMHAGDVVTGSPPLGFTFGLGALLLFPLWAGASTVLLPRPDPDSLVTTISRFSVTCLFTAPTQYRRIAALLSQRGSGEIRSLRLALSAGEPLPAELYESWRSVTGLPLSDGIGATEMLHIFIGATGQDTRAGATGRVLPGYEARIVDANFGDVTDGSPGRLVVRGPTGCSYLDDAEAQARYVVDGWNVTGDLYSRDSDGYFRFVAREDDMIISAGYNIAGPEVEAALACHPAVAECAVVGAPDAERGAIVKAFVVPTATVSDPASLQQELQQFVKARIAPYKYPRAIEFVDSLPRTATGKIQRKALRGPG